MIKIQTQSDLFTVLPMHFWQHRQNSIRKSYVTHYQMQTYSLYLCCYYGLEVCPTLTCAHWTLTLIHFFMKLFNTNVVDTVNLCQDYYDLYLPSVMIGK